MPFLGDAIELVRSLFDQNLVRAVVNVDSDQSELFTEANRAWVGPITRDTVRSTIMIPRGETVTQEIDFRQYTMMTVQMPANWDTASIGFKTAAVSGGYFGPLFDDDRVLMQIDFPRPGNHYTAPAMMAGPLFVQLWSQDGDGEDVVQTEPRYITITMKA